MPRPSRLTLCLPADNQKPNQWVQNVTVQQLPTTRPPAWPYRAQAVSSSVTVKSITFSTAKYIQATVTHTPLVNVTPAMVQWWFNGNIDGDMQHPLDGKWYPRYHVWHPRDHISQNTLITGEGPRSSADAVTALFIQLLLWWC